MARQPDIRYVQAYTYGSAARKLESLPSPKKKKAVLPKPKINRGKQRVIYVDPVALCALAAAGLLLITMVVGMIRLGMADSQTEALQAHVNQLQQENTKLREEFQSNYDPQLVQQQAKAQGMISASEAEHIRLELTLPQPSQEPGFWEQVKSLFAELFA